METNPTLIYPYFLAVAGSLLFASASVIFAHYESQASSAWVVAFKNIVGLIGFIFATVIIGIVQGPGHVIPTPFSIGCFVASGLMGLTIGDLFLFSAFHRIGSARTLMIYNFQPLLMAIGAYLVLGQTLHIGHVIALVFFMACVFVISYERYRSAGSWEIKGILFAFIGVLLDCIGIITTRIGFERSPEISPFSANLFRFVGTVSAFFIISRFYDFKIASTFRKMTSRSKTVIVIASFSAGFLSLSFWLMAIQVGHLASLAGIAAFSPVASAAFEAIYAKKKPTRGFFFAFSLFLVGFLFLFYR